MKHITKIIFFIIILFAVIIRLLYLFHTDINSDEAIVGLMGKHILEGKFPLFYYGQNYMGALEAYLTAVAFLVSQPSPLILKMVPFLCSILFVITTFILVKKLANESAGIFAMLFIAIPPSFLTIWSNAARGGYIETLLFGNIIFILLVNIMVSRTKKKIHVILLGIICGFSWWVNQLVSYYIATVLVCILIYPKGREMFSREKIIIHKGRLILHKNYFNTVLMITGRLLNYIIIFEIIALFFNLSCGKIGINTDFASFNIRKRDSILLLLGTYTIYLIFFRRRGLYLPKGIILFLTAFTIGNMPTCIYGLNHKLFAGTDVIKLSSFSSFLSNYWQINMPMILGLSMKEDLSSVFYRIMPILIFSLYAFFVFYFFISIIKYIMRNKTYPPIRYVLPTLMCFLSPLIYSFSRYGRFIGEARYILPIYTAIAILFSVTVVELFKVKFFKILSVLFTAFIILTNVSSNFRDFEKKQLESGNISASNKKVIDFLLSKGIYYAYADYWVAYKITFESNEKIICASLTQTRYPKYEELVSKQSSPAYIMRKGENKAFEDFLNDNKIQHEKEHIGDYWVYYSIDISNVESKNEYQEEYYRRIKSDRWTANSNINKNGLENAYDGDLSTRWTTNTSQHPEMFYMINLEDVYKIGKVELTSQINVNDYPRGCKIEISLDGKDWQTIIDMPSVNKDQFVFPILSHPIKAYWGWIRFNFKPVEAKYVKLIQIGNSDEYWWSINEVLIYIFTLEQ